MLFESKNLSSVQTSGRREKKHIKFNSGIEMKAMCESKKKYALCKKHRIVGLAE